MKPGGVAGTSPGPDTSGSDSARPNTSTRYCSPWRRDTSVASGPAPSASGAPSTSTSSWNAAPDHFQRDANGTAERRLRRAAERRGDGVGRAPANAAGAATRARICRAADSGTPGAGTTSTSSSVPSVSVPVLSRQTVSTDASDSIAFSCWASAPARAMRTAPAANVTDASSTRPSGTIEMSPAVAVCAASRNSVSCSRSAATRITASGIIASSSRRSSLLISSCRVDRRRLAARASAVSFEAYESVPTADTRYRPDRPRSRRPTAPGRPAPWAPGRTRR